VEQIAREQAFRRAVLSAYNDRCAVCGVRRETPDGRPEVEAAHLRAKADGGPDDIRNGIALCKLHHWAFDNGWFTITSDYDIIVTDAPERAGYTDFTTFDRQRLRLPRDRRKYPAKKYLE
jgi:putative restriction endonuclease